MFLLVMAPVVARQSNIISSVLRSGAMAKGILLILFLFSVVVWAIMAYKLIFLRAARRESEGFLKRFRNEEDKSRFSTICRRFKRSHLARVLETGLLREQNPGRHWWRLSPGEITEMLDRAVSSEVLRLEEMLVFLAIGGSVCPLLGLLGTVWGVMDAFLGMETYHSASISAVAPGISDALITTIAGLAAAIPAVIGYNYFVNQIGVMTTEMENFAHEVGSKFGKR
jgi:biopolymer transport protein TolQ